MAAPSAPVSAEALPPAAEGEGYALSGPALPADFDKAQFRTAKEVPAVVLPVRSLAAAMPTLNPLLQRIKGIKPVQECDQFERPTEGGGVEPVDSPKGYRLVLCDPAQVEAAALDKLATELGGWTQTHQVECGYDHLSREEVLRKLLPLESDPPSSYEQVGDVIHVNLRPEHWPYRRIIGRVLLDKGNSARVVVSKTGNIASKYRTFPMEVIAGDGLGGAELPSLVTTVRESGCRLAFDFRHVYWNSRLSMEHRRFVDAVVDGDGGTSGAEAVAASAAAAATGGSGGPAHKQRKPASQKREQSLLPLTGTVVADMTAGVGPFAVPLGRRGVTVLANDLNPESFKWLEHNIKANKVVGRVLPFRSDARAFIRRLLGVPLSATGPDADGGSEGLTPILPDQPRSFDHAVVNLPALSIELLSCFRGSFRRQYWSRPRLPVVHCYCFSQTSDPDAAAADVIRRVCGVLGLATESESDAALRAALGGEEGVETRVVRDVAPNKVMMLVRFRVPDAVAWTDGEGGQGGDDDAEGLGAQPAAKRGRLQVDA